MTPQYTRRVINRWTSPDDSAYVQGVEVAGGRTLYLAGAGGLLDTEGDPTSSGDGDITVQVHRSLDTIADLLAAADMGWEHVVRLNWFVVASALDDFWTAAYPGFRDRLARDHCRAAGTLLGVAALATPAALCEFEATAVAP